MSNTTILFRDKNLIPIWEKVQLGRRLSLADGLTLYHTPDFIALGKMAHHVQQQKSGDGGAKPASIPDVMTPSEAAAILKVSEEDVVAAINDGSLKARKLGSAYRISKEALETFLKG